MRKKCKQSNKYITYSLQVARVKKFNLHYALNIPKDLYWDFKGGEKLS